MLPFVTLALCLSVTPALALWPLPRQITTGTAALRLANGFDINLDVKGAPKDLKDAVSRTLDYLHKDKLQALVVDRGASSAGTVKAAKTLKSLTLSLTSTGTPKSLSDEAIAPLESRVEAYTLTIPSDGSAATLKANSTLGLYRGLTTFSQIWYELNGDSYTLEAPFNIVDSPAYVSLCAKMFG